MDYETFEIIAWSLASKTLTFAVFATSVFGMFVLYMRTSDVKWKTAYDKIESDPRALAQLFAGLFVAFAIGGGTIFG